MNCLPSRRAVLIAGALTALGRSAGLAQESNRTFRIGILAEVARATPSAFLDELGKAGFVERKNC
jgi:hypothetical protein